MSAQGLLRAAGLILSLATVAGFFGRSWWFADLFSHFRAQYALGLAVLAILPAARRRWPEAGALLALAGANALVLLPLFLPAPRVPDRPGPGLRAVLANVNNHRGDPERVARFALECDADILVLQEIGPRWLPALARLGNDYPYSIVLPAEDNFGLALYSRLPVIEREVFAIGRVRVPGIAATLETGRGPLRVVTVHLLPPLGAEYSRIRNEQFEDLPARLGHDLFPLILLGDFNAAPWNYYFRRMARRSGLSDSSRGYGLQATWPVFNPLLRIPIDHFLHSPEIHVRKRTVGPDIGSDHYPLVVDFFLPGEGPSTTGNFPGPAFRAGDLSR